MLITKREVNGYTVALQPNPYYHKGSKYYFEPKYRILYCTEGFSCWRTLFVCNNKKEFTLKNIKAELKKAEGWR